MNLLQRAAARSGLKSFIQPSAYPSADRPLSFAAPWSSPDREKIANDFQGYIEAAYKSDGVVFACSVARQFVFSQITFGWRKKIAGRPQDIHSDAGLEVLTAGYPGGLSELLSRMEAEGSVAGNWYGTVADDQGRLGHAAVGSGRRVVRMRPDWVTILIGSKSGDPYALDAKIAGYLYEPMGTGIGSGSPEPVILLPEEVAHYAPVPDPEARFRGMSWLTPIIREIEADKAATKHKLKFFSNGATLQTVVRMAKEVSPESFEAFVKKFNAAHQGVDNAYKTLFVGGGADATVVGADMRQLDFKSTQGAGETRIAAAARVHPVLVGLSEGMQGSSLNAGNYAAAKRNFVDGTMRNLWSVAAHCLANLVKPPESGDQLWPDDRDIAYLREDRKDVAEIGFRNAQSIRSLTDAGYTAESAVAAVVADDLRLLEHSGLFSVQLQPPGATSPPTDTLKEGS